METKFNYQITITLKPAYRKLWIKAVDAVATESEYERRICKAVRGNKLIILANIVSEVNFTEAILEAAWELADDGLKAGIVRKAKGPDSLPVASKFSDIEEYAKFHRVMRQFMNIEKLT